MSEELQTPPVIDLEAMLQPIPGDNPSGEYLRYSSLYDQISEARRADMDVNQGEWKTELKVADFPQVIQLAVPALITQTKDLQIAAWLSEALIKEQGFAGLRDGMKLLAGLQAELWDTLHPEIDEGDMEGRANALSWFDTQAALAVRGVAITGSVGYSLNDYDDSKIFDIPDNIDSLSVEEQKKYSALKEKAEREHRVTPSQWAAESGATKRAACEKIEFVIQECWQAYDELNKTAEEKFDRNQVPSLGQLKKSLDAVHTQAKKLLEEKRIEEPDAEPEEEIVEGTDGEAVAAGGTANPGVAAGAIQGRSDALKRLAEIASFFHRTEPHSPVSYLVQRAVKWGNMPLEGWLQEVIKDQSVLFQLKETLGFGAGGPDDGGNTPSA